MPKVLKGTIKSDVCDLVCVKKLLKCSTLEALFVEVSEALLCGRQKGFKLILMTTISQ